MLPPDEKSVPVLDFKKRVADFESKLIDEAMKATSCVMLDAAKYLGLSPHTMKEKLRRYGWMSRYERAVRPKE